MHESSTSLDRFIRRVYRRLLVLRLAEWAGLGFGAGCTTALVSVLILRNQTESSLTIVAAQMLLGIAVGFVAAILRRPRIIDAAVEADRQLDLADLLATAWQLQHSPQRDSFEAAVLLTANDRAAHLQPRSVVLHRLGLRAWSGIGLAGALVLTICLLTANPIDTQAASSPFAPQIASNKSQNPNNPQNNSQLSTARRTTPISPDHPGGEDDPLPGAGNTTDTTTTSTRGQNTDVQAANPNGAGAGAGKSTGTPDKTNSPSIGANTSRTANTGNAASGVGASIENPNTTSGTNTSTSTGNATKSPTAPAWQSDAWPQAQRAADTAINNGAIPPAYHDLVREYFKH